MTERSRIKFNPQNKEIEIEGSEEFVKIYFEKICGLLSGCLDNGARNFHRPSGRTGEISPEGDPVAEGMPKNRLRRKSGNASGGAKDGRKGKRGTILNTVLALIRSRKEGSTTTQLKDETGFTERQIWTVIYKAERAGKIRREKRGVYVGV